MVAINLRGISSSIHLAKAVLQFGSQLGGDLEFFWLFPGKLGVTKVTICGRFGVERSFESQVPENEYKIMVLL